MDEIQREKARARTKRWRLDHLEQRREYEARWRAEHAELMRSYRAKWKANNTDKWKVSDARWQATHREQRRASSLRWRENHSEQHRESAARWSDGHREYVLMMNRRRYARKMQARRSDLTNQQWIDRVAEFGGFCAYCLRPMDKVTMDHMTPLSRGGDHTLSNVVPCCQTCNSHKHSSTLLEFVTRMDRL